MNRTIRNWVMVSMLLVCLIAPMSAATAQSGGGYDLTWSTIDGGGYTFSTGGSYSLGGTAGQSDANASLLSGGNYTLGGGFWNGGVILYRIYLPLILRQ